METIRPQAPEELVQVMWDAAERKRRIRIFGAGTKDAMAGPVAPADRVISTTALTRVLEYEPRDLTISVEAGMRWADLVALLAANGQMLPLDPPFFAEATVGGVVAANTCGARRRMYGTARDSIIGMKFATLEGKLVQSGGMVVKNVAGLDMAKLMIGSFGTLAAIAVVNWKVTPLPEGSRTFVQRFETLDAALTERDRILAGPLPPAALDLLNPGAAALLALDGFCLITHACGNDALLRRWSAHMPGAEARDGASEEALMRSVREFTPAYLKQNADATVLRVSGAIGDLGNLIDRFSGPVLARAATGVVYAYGRDPSAVPLGGLRGVVEFAPAAHKSGLELWPSPGSDFPLMERIKQTFDPEGLLNRGRLYGRI